MHLFSYIGGRLFCEGADLGEVADRFGTPVYVYSAGTIRGNFLRLSRALAPLDHMVCYAVKANSNLAVLNLLAREGAGFDIVSGGELFRVLKAGGRADRCTFAGVGKTADEIAYALKEGVYCFNVESEAELDRIDRIAGSLGLVAPVAIRVNPDVDARTHEFISTGKSKNKFGIGLDRAAEVYDKAGSLGNLRVLGVQTHIGSQILEAEPFAEAAGKLAGFIRDLRSRHPVEFFSIGGGDGDHIRRGTRQRGILVVGGARFAAPDHARGLRGGDSADSGTPRAAGSFRARAVFGRERGCAPFNGAVCKKDARKNLHCR